MIQRVGIAVCTLICCVLMCPVREARAQEPGHTPELLIVLAPQAHYGPFPTAADFMDMFQPDAPWKDAASHVQVFQISMSYLKDSSQEIIDTIVADLKRRGIALGLAGGSINISAKNSPCGGAGKLEGYALATGAEMVSQHIKAAHGELKYVAMDEPLYYGHYYTQREGKVDGCHSSIHEVMALSKETLSVYVREFPDVVIGDVEPTGHLDEEPGWQSDLTEWATEFRTAMGKPLAFLDLDVVWNRPHAVEDAVQIVHFAQQLQQQGLLGKIGIIYNGAKQDTSDKSWVADARKHVSLMEGKYELRPERVIFQSWHPNPTHALPDSARDTLTSLVNFYFTPAVKQLRGEK